MMAIARGKTIAPQSGQPQQVRVLATICDGCLGRALGLWGCNLSPCPLVQQCSGQCASHTPSRCIINNVLCQGGFPLVQRIPGSNGEIIHWVGLGGKAVATCTPDRTTDKQTINVQNNSNACDGLLLQSTGLAHQCPMPQCNASMQCLNAMPPCNASLTNASM